MQKTLIHQGKNPKPSFPPCPNFAYNNMLMLRVLPVVNNAVKENKRNKRKPPPPIFYKLTVLSLGISAGILGRLVVPHNPLNPLFV